MKVKNLISKYFQSRRFLTKKPATQESYKLNAKRVCEVLASENCMTLSRKEIVKYHNYRSGQSEVQANRELAFLSLVYSWAMNELLFDLTVNPCRNIYKNKEYPRDKYISNEEYLTIYHEADNPVIRGIMEVSFLCGARQKDVLELETCNLWEKGIYIKQSKTGKRQIKAWSQRLIKAVNDAIQYNIDRGIKSDFVFNNRLGKPYSSDGFVSTWYKFMKRTRDKTGMKLDFTFNDIKAKAVSDFEGNKFEKQQFTGHLDIKMIDIYDRKLTVSPTLQLPIIKNLE